MGSSHNSVNFQLFARSVSGNDMVFVSFDFDFAIVERNAIALNTHSLADGFGKV